MCWAREENEAPHELIWETDVNYKSRAALIIPPWPGHL